MFKNITNQVVSQIAQELVVSFTPILEKQIAVFMQQVEPLIQAEIDKMGQSLINEIPNIEKVIQEEVPVIINALVPIIQNEMNSIGQQVVAQLKTMK